MMGIDSFDAIINTPEAAILAVGRVRTVPEWREDGWWAPRRVISATLSVDHRVADGADGARSWPICSPCSPTGSSCCEGAAL